jgi:hypothetical protein
MNNEIYYLCENEIEKSISKNQNAKLFRKPIPGRKMWYKLIS